MKLWIVGRFRRGSAKPWDVLGVYDDEAKAEAACTDYLSFVAPVELNAPVETGIVNAPDGLSTLPGVRFPKGPGSA